MKKYRGIGLMSGSSLDGLDIVCCEFLEEANRFRFEVIASETVSIPELWQGRLLKLPVQGAEIMAKTHVYFGHWLGEQTKKFIEKHKLQVDFVASHGHTLFHQPDKNFTFQLGDGETLVSYLACPLVSNFRNKNVAMGGQGAPLVPFGEQALFPDHKLFLNLGGIANLTFGKYAFDVGPCNQVLNFLAHHHDNQLSYDPDGSLAAQGDLRPDLLESLNQLPYYRQPPPKSLGNGWIYHDFFPLLLESEVPEVDGLRTVVEHISFQIARALRKIGAADQPMLVTGGGYRNKFLMQKIAEKIRPLGIEVAEVPLEIVDFKEAIIFAFLGLCTLKGLPNVLGSASGVGSDMLGGSIHLPPGGGIAVFPL